MWWLSSDLHGGTALCINGCPYDTGLASKVTFIAHNLCEDLTSDCDINLLDKQGGLIVSGVLCILQPFI